MKVVSDSRPLGIVLGILVFLAFLGMVTVNALANILPINGVNTGVLSDEIPNLFVPAGITFAIWGLIYALLAAFAIIALVQAFSRHPFAGAWEPLDSSLFILNGLANIGWIFAWHYRQIGLSLAIMLVILGTLIALSERIFKRLSPGGALSPKASPKAPSYLRVLLSLPIHVYLGWICVATIANATALLVKLGWGGWGIDPRVWTIVVIAAGLAIALGFVFLRRGVAAPLVVVWAYAGIVIKRVSIDGTADPTVWISASVAALTILVCLVARFFKKR